MHETLGIKTRSTFAPSDCAPSRPTSRSRISIYLRAAVPPRMILKNISARIYLIEVVNNSLASNLDGRAQGLRAKSLTIRIACAPQTRVSIYLLLGFQIGMVKLTILRIATKNGRAVYTLTVMLWKCTVASVYYRMCLYCPFVATSCAIYRIHLSRLTNVQRTPFLVTSLLIL